jgi:hypothetical protein
VDASHAVIVVLLASMAGTFFRLQFIYAAGATWLLYLLFLVVTLTTHSYNSIGIVTFLMCIAAKRLVCAGELCIALCWLAIGTVLFSTHSYTR